MKVNQFKNYYILKSLSFLLVLFLQLVGSSGYAHTEAIDKTTANTTTPIENSQHRNYARELVNKQSKKFQSVALSQLFNISKGSKKTSNKTINEAINGKKDFLNLDLSFNKRILTDKDDILKLSIPIAGATPLKLLLKKTEFLSQSIKVPAPSGEMKGICDWCVFYWGAVEVEMFPTLTTTC